jgi:hypothetical protein
MENYGVKNNTKSLGKLMVEAGYTKESAKNPKLIIESETVQEGIQEFLSMLDDKRRMAITQITQTKLEKAPARELAYVADIMTKNHQLLTGGNTETIGVTPITDVFVNGVQDSSKHKKDSVFTEED